MPTYEYICEKCGPFDIVQSMKDDPLTICPKKKCKGKVQRSISGGAGLIFKGDGFYTTDYRSEGYKEAAKKDKPPAKSEKSEKKSSDSSSKKSKSKSASSK
ncbi:MAG: FmdB family transcriptional regulator [Verrucomicrobiales bacterium]|nr:FmdB family transcriptional regulator [Verrucomicrobiales bacterium]|tara:strand:+ start:217 stop:519 length:303 start_codon:yes stop_codon:yes gene_type:complete